MLRCYILTLCAQTSRYKADMAAVNIAHAEAMEECRTSHICLQVCFGQFIESCHMQCHDMAVLNRLYLRIQRIPNCGVEYQKFCSKALSMHARFGAIYIACHFVPASLSCPHPLFSSPPCLLSFRQSPTATALTSADPQSFL